MNPSHSDRALDHFELIRLIANGDEAAFRNLYDQFRARVYNTSFSYLQNQFEAEEITQDVFVELYQSAARFDGRSAVSTWVYRIAVNKSLDRLRRRSRRKRFAQLTNLFSPESGELAHDAPDFDHPGAALEKKENARLLFKAMNALAESQKTAFILAYVEELSGKEVAEVMKLSPKAVESLLQRAKANLRKELEKFYPERRGKKL
jgi:RNA polymerase sigma-70 factor (ECF subfamily)